MGIFRIFFSAFFSPHPKLRRILPLPKLQITDLPVSTSEITEVFSTDGWQHCTMLETKADMYVENLRDWIVGGPHVEC